VALTSFEQDLLGAYIEDIRAGVRPFSDTSVGICTRVDGKRTCPKFMGTRAGELPEGEYQLFGEFAVPRLGGKDIWRLDMEWSCETVKDNGDGNISTQTSSKSQQYKVTYAGKDKGYRLAPMVTINSPYKHGRRTCTYTITAPSPDGDKVYSGGWTVPQAE